MATVGLRGGPDPATDDRVAQLDALYRVEYAGMVRLAYTLLANNAEAEEIVQDSLIGCIGVGTRFESLVPTCGRPGLPRARCRHRRVPDLLRVSPAGTVTDAPGRRLLDPH